MTQHSSLFYLGNAATKTGFLTHSVGREGRGVWGVWGVWGVRLLPHPPTPPTPPTPLGFLTSEKYMFLGAVGFLSCFLGLHLHKLVGSHLVGNA
ncbi:hypothetical protein [Nostoc sp.]|uniref:hypothetical protein n=1 Tax=Nostoc sp. TaxID=1180 RepID=UPI002FF9CBA4